MQKENITKETSVLIQADMNEMRSMMTEIVTEAVGELAIITKKGFDGVYERLDKVELRLDKVEVRLDRVEDRLGDVEEGVDSFKRVWFNHEARIGKLESKRV